MTSPEAPGRPRTEEEPPIRLRRATPADAEMIHDWRNEPSAGRFQPLRPVTVAELRSLLAETAHIPFNPRFSGRARWVIEANAQPVGTITLTVESREHGLGTLGYGIGERHRGHGYAGAAVRALLHLAFSPEGADLWRLEAVADVANVASHRVLERTGFLLEGIARSYFVIAGRRVDHARYALLREEWARGTTGETRPSHPTPVIRPFGPE